MEVYKGRSVHTINKYRQDKVQEVQQGFTYTTLWKIFFISVDASIKNIHY